MSARKMNKLTIENIAANTAENTAELTGFAKLGITGPLLKATAVAGFDNPKPIQIGAIPPHLAGRDVLAVAQTGSGKTAAFSLPILTKIIALGTKRSPRTCRALILAPTRELAVQIEDTIRILAKGLHVATALVLGGVSRSSQVRKMAPGVDTVILGNDPVNEEGDGFASVQDSDEFKLANELRVEFTYLTKIIDLVKL